MQIVGELLRGMDTRQLSVQLSAGELLTVRNDADMKRSHCYGTFTFSDFGLVKFFGDGVCARAADNAAFISSVAAHPLWSDKQIAAELLRLGARYGPDSKERLIERISAAAIGEAVAEPLDLREVTFVMPERVSGRIELHGDALVWMSTFTIVNRQNATIVALIEPFDGRLKSLFRIPPE
jgi:hypothetical protein